MLEATRQVKTTSSRGDVRAIRQAIRAAALTSHTAGLAGGFLQANLVIMPEIYALDFMRYCQRNPRPCPLVGVSDTGNPMMTTLGADIDVRTDIPSYNVYQKGAFVEQVLNITEYWRDDMVAFALGCSFTFEHALQQAGIAMRHIDNNYVVPMFQTNIQTVAAGLFSGNLVVSMRSIRKSQLQQTEDICAAFPLAHGTPIHSGNPECIGIYDINKPHWGAAIPVAEGEIVSFWACGVTSQVAIQQAQIPLCITHTPGCMLITDIDERASVPVFITKGEMK